MLAERIDAFTVARMNNAVANGRLFNILMFVLILVVALRFNENSLWLALAPMMSVGAAYVAGCGDGRFQAVFSIASIAFAVSSFLVIFFI